MAVTRIFLCHDVEPASQIDITTLTPLLARLQERGFDIVSYPGHLDDEHFLPFAELYLPNCQWFVLFQTPGLAAHANVQRVVERALELAQQQNIQGVLRLTTLLATDEGPVEWAALPTFDGTHDPLRAIEKLLLALPSNEAGGETITRAPVARPPEPVTSPTYDRPVVPASRLVRFRGSVGNRYQDAMYSHRRAIIIVSVLVLVALLGSTTLVLVQRLNAPPPAPASIPVYGQVAFFSTNLVGTEVNRGIANGVQISLWNLPAPAARNSYYAWLLPGISNAEGQRVLAGQFTPSNGNASITYINPNANLLATKSRLLITEESSAPLPTFPSPDPHRWRYYGALPQTPNPQDSSHFSALDHLRHLLSDDSMSSMAPLPGGLGAWLLQNVRLIFEWSSNAWGFGRPVDLKSALARNDLIAILDTLDGAMAVSQDVPQNTPLVVDQSLSRKPLLSLDPGAQMPGYLLEMNTHLFGFASSPGTTPAAQKLAGTINQELDDLQKTLEQLRQDAKAILARTDDSQLNALFADLLNQAMIAYTGQIDASTDARVGGACLIFAQLQQLTQFQVIQYSNQIQL
ncbi:MAG TPA: hypothetical protein VF458_15635 [Ktedonobacteraceae bacterium]